MNTLYTIIALLLLPLSVMAQNDLKGSTSEWKISHHSDMDSKQETNLTSVLLLGEDMISWGPSKDDLFSMLVTKVSGSWNKETNVGQAIFKVEMEDDGKAGKVFFRGDENGITIELKLKHEKGASKLKLMCEEVIYE